MTDTSGSYETEFGLPGAALYSVPDVPDPDVGVAGDRAWSQNGNTYHHDGNGWNQDATPVP